MLKYSLGIDVSKADFHCNLSTIDSEQKIKIKGSRKFSNTPSGFKELKTWVEKLHKDKSVSLVVAMEATGVYYERLALYLTDKGFHVSVLLPNKAKNYILSKGFKSKNDKIDARGLAQMGAEQRLDSWSPHSKYFYNLRTLTRQHQNLQELKTVINNQLKALDCAMFKNRLVVNQQESMLKKIEKNIKKLETEIQAHIERDEVVKKKVDNIIAIKGVGILTVAVILAETNGFELFKSARQLVSYAGYDVVENQSGKHTGKTRISKKGNSRIRRILHLPAFNVVTHKQTPFVSLYERVFERTKMKMKGYVAVQRKLLVIIYALWKKDERYNLNYCQNKYTGEKEQVPTSLHGLEQANRSNKNSIFKNEDATQGQHTVEKSQFAASPQLQK